VRILPRLDTPVKPRPPGKLRRGTLDTRDEGKGAGERRLERHDRQEAERQVAPKRTKKDCKEKPE
jgi:hypothetical protein